MKKYTAMVGWNKIISVFACNEEEAIRAIEIQLRGRLGRIDFYKRWIDGGRKIEVGK